MNFMVHGSPSVVSDRARFAGSPMREIITDQTGYETPAASRRERRIEPREVALWLDAHRGVLVQRWLSEVSARVSEDDEHSRALLGDFFEFLAALLRDSMGPQREQVDVLWRQTAELYGNVGAMRGLAAGEIIEEFQFLRDALIRLLYTNPPPGGLVRVSLRDVLRVNRFIDRGVTHASIGHTDSLFFAHFQGTGVPERLTAELVDEVRRQLMAIEVEYAALRRRLVTLED